MVERSAPVRVKMPTSSPSSSTAGASRCRVEASTSKASRGSIDAFRVTISEDITSATWVNRSTEVQSASVTTPTGRPSSTTTAARWARLGSSASASLTVACGTSVIGVSKTGCRRFTHETTSSTMSSGMSWGRTLRPPRRAIVSAIRRPETAVMFATTIGIVVPVPSAVARSTS